MTLEQFRCNWQRFALLVPTPEDGLYESYDLTDLFVFCWGEFQQGLVFEGGGETAKGSAILRPDEKNNLYRRTGPGETEWQLMGRLVRMDDFPLLLPENPMDVHLKPIGIILIQLE